MLLTIAIIVGIIVYAKVFFKILGFWGGISGSGGLMLGRGCGILMEIGKIFGGLKNG